MTLEVVFTWPSGREEVRYRRASGSPESAEFKSEVEALRKKHGDQCPYSCREVE